MTFCCTTQADSWSLFSICTAGIAITSIKMASMKEKAPVSFVVSRNKLGDMLQNRDYHVHQTLSPLIFFFICGCTKDRKFSLPVPDTDILKARIRDALAAVTEETLEGSWPKCFFQTFSRQERKHLLKCTNMF